VKAAVGSPLANTMWVISLLTISPVLEQYSI